MDSIASKIEQFGYCTDLVPPMKEAAREYDQAQRSADSVESGVWAGSVAFGVAGVAALGCVIATATGPGALACWAAVGLAAVGGALSFDSALTAAALAEEMLEDKEKNLDKAVTNVCGCLERSFP